MSASEHDRANDQLRKRSQCTRKRKVVLAQIVQFIGKVYRRLNSRKERQGLTRPCHMLRQSRTLSGHQIQRMYSWKRNSHMRKMLNQVAVESSSRPSLCNATGSEAWSRDYSGSAHSPRLCKRGLMRAPATTCLQSSQREATPSTKPPTKRQLLAHVHSKITAPNGHTIARRVELFVDRLFIIFKHAERLFFVNIGRTHTEAA